MPLSTEQIIIDVYLLSSLFPSRSHLTSFLSPFLQSAFDFHQIKFISSLICILNRFVLVNTTMIRVL